MAERPKILITGAGARETALAWKLRQGSEVDIFVAPGNKGTAEFGMNLGIDQTDVVDLTSFSRDAEIDLVVVGSEDSLKAGVTDALREIGIPVFGPSREAAEIETRKDGATNFMDRHGIPHPETWNLKDMEEVENFIRLRSPREIVVKKVGLEGGKGVTLPDTKHEVRIKAHEGIEKNGVIQIQERLEGDEISAMAFTDGNNVVPLLFARDYKKLNDEDKGSNTGGMGAIAPVHVDAKTQVEIFEIQKKIVTGLRLEGTPFVGAIYVQIILTQDGPKVLEVNARLGDPEWQALAMLFNTNLLNAMLNTVNGILKSEDIGFYAGSSVAVVLTSQGYPGKHPQRVDNLVISDKLRPGTQIFRGGNSGRIATVTGRGRSLAEAREKAYRRAGDIEFGDGKFKGRKPKHYRHDVGE